MQTAVLLAVIVGIAVYLTFRLRVLEDRLVLLKRLMDKQVSEADVEYLVKMVHDSTSGEIEARLQSIEAQCAPNVATSEAPQCTSEAPQCTSEAPQ